MNVSTSSTYIQLQNANECKWDFMLDASTIQPVQLQNANEILCWMLQLFNLYNYKMLIKFLNIYNYKMKMMIWKESTTKWFQIQNGGHNPSCLYKKILAGNLYCSPSPPHFVAEIWRWVVSWCLLPKRCFLLAHALSTAQVPAQKKSFLPAHKFEMTPDLNQQRPKCRMSNHGVRWWHPWSTIIFWHPVCEKDSI